MHYASRHMEASAANESNISCLRLHFCSAVKNVEKLICLIMNMPLLPRPSRYTLFDYR